MLLQNIAVSISPSNNAQKIATIGIVYVTAEANNGEAILTNLLNKVWAIALLKTPKIKINKIEVLTSESLKFKDVKSERKSTTNAGGEMDKKYLL